MTDGGLLSRVMSELAPIILGGTYSREAFPVIMLVAQFVYCTARYCTALYCILFGRLCTVRHGTVPLVFFGVFFARRSPAASQSIRARRWMAQRGVSA